VRAIAASTLACNPSHLEIVDPVVLGKVRAKQDQHRDPRDHRLSVMPLLLHGAYRFFGAHRALALAGSSTGRRSAARYSRAARTNAANSFDTFVLAQLN